MDRSQHGWQSTEALKMARVFFTANLARYFPNLKEDDIEAVSVREVLEQVNGRYPGLKGYIVDERGVLRKHVNIFVDGEPVRDEENLSDKVSAATKIHFIQALSGG